MAEKSNVSEGTIADFIKNFRKMYEVFQNRYGLTQEEAQALNNEHLRQATNNAATAAAAGAGAAGGGAFPLGSAIAGGASVRLNADLLSRMAKQPNAITSKWDDLEEPDPEITGPFVSYDGQTTKEVNNLNRALKKIKGTGIYPAGAFNEQLNSSFLTNLRKNRK